MKRLGLLAVFVLGLWTVCRAEVTATIIAKDIDSEGNIQVWTQYKIDGKEVESRYPKINDKNVWATRYNALVFYNMTDEQIKNKILSDVEQYSKYLIQKQYCEINNRNFLEKKLSTLINSTVITQGSEIPLSEKLSITVKTDGTKVEIAK